MTREDISHLRSGLQNGLNEFTITMTDSPDPADVEVVKQGLDSFDASQGAVVDWVPLALFARNAEGIIVAGLTGSKILVVHGPDLLDMQAQGLHQDIGKHGDAVILPLCHPGR